MDQIKDCYVGGTNDLTVCQKGIHNFLRQNLSL